MKTNLMRDAALAASHTAQEFKQRMGEHCDIELTVHVEGLQIRASSAASISSLLVAWDLVESGGLTLILMRLSEAMVGLVEAAVAHTASESA